MACATTTRPTFSLHISTPFSQTKTKTKSQTPHFITLPKTPSLLLSLAPHMPFKKVKAFSKLTPNSIDVSKEDKPTSDQPSDTDPQEQEDEEKLDKRRLEEKFAVLNTGIYECRSCGYKYDEALGDPSYPIPPGLPFEKLPEDWRCPTCGASQSFFDSKSVEIAGFAQNQQFGLGGNALTSGQKALLIYGTLFFFFVLFLSGYFLQ